jgi:3-deoxy-D-manno-octulosonate cytidylyltransferase
MAEALNLLTVIPARYGSTRFPGKPLALLKGKPMIAHVWDRVQESGIPGKVLVATDDERIAEAVIAHGGQAVLTLPNHPSGTDRVWEVASQYPHCNYVLNLQGDEPFINPLHLQTLVQAVATYPQATILTLVCPLPAINTPEFEAAYSNPNWVKAIRARSGQLLYCTRAAAPALRDGQTYWQEALANGAVLKLPLYRHLGVYLYQRSALQTLSQLPPSPLEQLERLEQLRALEAGLTLFAPIVDKAPHGVDTPEDLALLQN